MIRESSIIALRALRRNTMQTLLTTIGMTIGVGTVLAMIAVGSGAQRSITTQVRAAGMNVIVVSSGNYRMPQQWTNQGEADEPVAWHPVFRPGRASLRRVQESLEGTTRVHNPTRDLMSGPENYAGLGAAETLSLEDAKVIAGMQGVQAVSGGVHDNTQVIAGSTSWATQVRGEQASLPEIRRAWVMPHGRFFTADEDKKGAAVVVLGSIVSSHLFGDKNPVGERISVHGEPFVVIGTIASGSWMVPAAAGDGQFDAVYVPVRAGQKMLARGFLDTVTLSAASTGDVTQITRKITAELRGRHHLASDKADDFTVASQAHAAIAKGGMRTDISKAMMGNAAVLDKVTLTQLSRTLEKASRTMSVLLTSIAAVSLIVGGIGIMNIMLLSVTERTREIGIRRAVGARSSAVMQQFLMEAVILSLGGGVLGIGLGIGVSYLVAHLVQWTTEVSWVGIAVSFTISAAVGVVFGYYPARQASRVTPMTSLRYE